MQLVLRKINTESLTYYVSIPFPYLYHPAPYLPYMQLIKRLLTDCYSRHPLLSSLGDCAFKLSFSGKNMLGSVLCLPFPHFLCPLPHLPPNPADEVTTYCYSGPLGDCAFKLSFSGKNMLGSVLSLSPHPLPPPHNQLIK